MVVMVSVESTTGSVDYGGHGVSGEQRGLWWS